MEALAALSDDALERLASALRRGVLRAPFGAGQLAVYLPEALCAGAAAALSALVASGASEQAAALTLRAMVQARAAVPSVADRVRLVTSGPAPQAEGRDTAVVVRELFAQAEQEVLVVGFTADTGRGCLHAKCVVVDGHLSFITSANFTEAAQDRNIEVGVLLRDEDFARSLRGHFEGLIASGKLQQL